MNMIGSWKLVPDLTTGHDEFGTAMGMTPEQISGSRDVIYTFSLSRRGEAWHMKIDTETQGTWLDVTFNMDIPFSYASLDGQTKLTSLITLQNDHFIEQMTSEKDGKIDHWSVDTYRDGDYVVTAQTKDGATKVEKLRKI